MAKKLSKKSQDGSCPKCGGSSWTAKRSLVGKFSVGILAPKSRVKCVLCGEVFKRG